MPDPFYDDGFLTLYGGDCRDVLSAMSPESVHCVVTSPPYWGLRDYGTATWEGETPQTCPECGGKGETPESAARDEACARCSGIGTIRCDHKGKPVPTSAGFNERYFGRPSSEDNKQDDMRREVFRDTCRKCGARRIDSQLGLEPTPEEYVANMVAVFREVRRVLRADGTLWLNLGDSYISGQGGRQSEAGALRGTIRKDRPDPKARPELDNAPSGWAERAVTPRVYPGADNSFGWKPKDLAGMPWRVAFALQADGWYLRSDIIWAKPNPMPESVTDRPTKAHEYVFLLSKSARYYYDADAVREAGSDWSAKMPDGWDTGEGGHGAFHRNGREKGANNGASGSGRNLRSVWTIATEPYPGAHFATFPRKLVEPCVKAGTSERGVCPECGAPWVREVERKHYGSKAGDGDPMVEGFQRNKMGGQKFYDTEYEPPKTTGWRATCAHDAGPVPAVVLDPFAGSGTTLLVAQALGRRGVGIDLNPEYLEMAVRRGSREFGRGTVKELAAKDPDEGLWALDG